MQGEDTKGPYQGIELDEDTIRRTLNEEVNVATIDGNQSVLAQKEAELKALEQRDMQIREMEELIEQKRNTQEK